MVVWFHDPVTTDRLQVSLPRQYQGEAVRLARETHSLEVQAGGGASGVWTSCTHSDDHWRLAVTGSDGSSDWTGGGALFLYLPDNGAFDQGATGEVIGRDRQGRRVFFVEIGD